MQMLLVPDESKAKQSKRKKNFSDSLWRLRVVCQWHRIGSLPVHNNISGFRTLFLSCQIKTVPVTKFIGKFLTSFLFIPRPSAQKFEQPGEPVWEYRHQHSIIMRVFSPKSPSLRLLDLTFN